MSRSEITSNSSFIGSWLFQFIKGTAKGVQVKETCREDQFELIQLSTGKQFSVTIEEIKS